MRKFLFSLWFCTFFSCASFADGLKVAVVDVNTIFESSTSAAALIDDIKAKQEDIRTKFITEKEQLDGKRKELHEQKGVLSEESLNEKMRALSDEAVSAERRTAEAVSKLDSEYLSRIEDIGKQVKKLIGQSALEKNVDLVINSAQVLYSSANVLDMTNDVVAMLNAKPSDKSSANVVGTGSEKAGTSPKKQGKKGKN